MWGSWNILGTYWWAMKYFSKFLMDHKIFSCYIFVVLFFRLRGLEHKISKLASRKFKKDMFNKSHPLGRYRANGGKSEKKVWYILTLMLGSLWQIFFSNLYLFDFIFSIIVWTILIIAWFWWRCVLILICFPDNCCYKNW